MTDERETERRLFTTIPPGDPLHEAVRTGLEGMRRSGNPELRELAGAVLDGRSDVRALLSSSAFAPLLAAAAERSQQETAAMTPEERARHMDTLRQEALARWRRTS